MHAPHAETVVLHPRALLDEGTSLRMPPHAATELASWLAPGAHVHAWGRGIGNRYGRTIEVDEIAELVDAAVDA